jgi:tetratricopeptide (TPR) repeat protein
MNRKPAETVRPFWKHWDFTIDNAADAPSRVLRRFDKSQIEFEIGFLEDILARNPTHLDTMKLLADLYTRNRQYRQGLKLDRQIVAALPRDATAHYNLACSLALTNRLDECFERLNQAIRLGYREYEHMALDPDLEAARKDPRWAALFGIPTEV